MKKFTLFFGLFMTISTYSQMYFSDIGSDPSYCRTQGYQAGSGVVWAAASGGQAPYTYLWEQLGTANTSSNTTWAARVPGQYKITVTDGNSAILIDTVEVDSINPVANFAVSGSSITGAGVLFYGTAPVNVTFDNLSTGVVIPNDPLSDTIFFWQFTQFDTWNFVDTYNSQNYNYNFAGYYGVSLVAQNKNACTDTAYVQIFLDGPAGLEKTEEDNFNIFRSDENISASFFGNSEQKEIVFYDLSGKIIKKEQFFGENATFSWEAGIGTYLYECRDSKSGEILAKGKFVY